MDFIILMKQTVDAIITLPVKDILRLYISTLCFIKEKLC